MTIYQNPDISQSLFVIPALVRRHSQMHPKFSPALRRAPKLVTITPIVLLYQSPEIPVTPVPVVSNPSYSEGLLEYPPRVKYSPEIDASQFTLHILSDTPGVFQRLKYILLMLLGITTDNVCLNYTMTRMLQSILEALGIPWPAMCHAIACIAHITQLALAVFMSSFNVSGHTMSWEAHERDYQFGGNESIDIGKSQTLPNESNDSINKVSAMRPDLAKIIVNV